jgi:hypothetical protein
MLHLVVTERTQSYQLKNWRTLMNAIVASGSNKTEFGVEVTFSMVGSWRVILRNMSLHKAVHLVAKDVMA